MLMGSASDWKHLEGAVRVMDQLGLRSRVHVSSAHRTPERTLEMIRKAESDGCRVFICAAGMAAHLAGVVAAHTTRPVLGVPLPGGVLDGMDALLATVQMPGGIPVATFAVGGAGAKNAAFFAAQVVALERSDVAQALAEARRAGVEGVETGDAKIQASRTEQGSAP
jgi:5-(carboxyamino)imidazole ribonucleotide mutase